MAIERSMSSPLAPIYELCDWMAFCDKVDETLKPMEALKKKIRRIQIGLSVFAVCVMVSLVINTVISFQYEENREYRIVPAFVVAGFLIIVVPVLVALPAGKKITAESDLIKEDLQRIINEQSARRPDVSFHLREDLETTFAYEGTGSRNRIDNYTITQKALMYIECVIDNTLTATVPMGGEVEATIVTPVVTAFDTLAAEVGMNGRKEHISAAERLKELEATKDILSEEEYNQKKSAILASI